MARVGPNEIANESAGVGHLRPFAVAAEISSERPFTPARRSSGGGRAAPAASEEACRSRPAELGNLIKQEFGIAFVRPLKGERRAGKTAQQPFASGGASGLDAHRGAK
jgi:hypothetical protein